MFTKNFGAIPILKMMDIDLTFMKLLNAALQRRAGIESGPSESRESTIAGVEVRVIASKVKSEIRHIVFDFGGVLVDWNPHYLYLKVFDRDPRKVDPKLRWKARAQREAIFTSEPVPERARPKSGPRNPAPAAPGKRLSLIAQAKAGVQRSEIGGQRSEAAAPHLPTSSPSHLPTFAPSHFPTPPHPHRPTPSAPKFISQSSPVPPPPPLLPTRTFLKQAALFSIAAAVPYLLTCVILWLAGVFPQFWFWTVTYAGKYASALPIADGPSLLRNALRTVIGPNVLFWILPWVGATVLWWDWRLKAQNRFLLCALLVCSLASASVGLYFRGHYFIPVLPVLGLLIGVAVSRAVWLLRHDRTLELMLAFPVLLLFIAGIVVPLSGHGALWFAASAQEAVRRVYSTSLLTDAALVADHLRTNTPPDARIAVLGSEPQIYFLSKRRSATGHIYTYALMEPQPYARRMQEEMIAEIERNQPAFVVYVEEPYSWLRRDGSEPRLFDWWSEYWPRELALVKTVPIETEIEDRVEATGANIQIRQGKRIRTGQLLVFQRKPTDQTTDNQP